MEDDILIPAAEQDMPNVVCVQGLDPGSTLSTSVAVSLPPVDATGVRGLNCEEDERLEEYEGRVGSCR